MRKIRKILYFWAILICVLCNMTIVHAGTQTKKIYQNEKLTIQLNPKLKVKKIEKSNKSFRIKKCGVNKYTICSGRPGKGMVTVYTNKNNYRYSIVVRKKKIIEKEMTVYQNNSVDIKVDASVKVKEINRSNKNISIKEKSGNTYTILPKKVGKSVVTIQTNRSIYKYEISIKNQPGLNSSMLSDYIKKKNPRKIIFTNKVKNNKTTDLSMQGNKAVVGWMDKDTLYIGSKHGAYVDCYDASFLFFDLPNIEYIDVTYLNTAPSQSAESMFGSCPRLKEIKGGTGDYARCSTGFDGMFRNSGNLKRIYVGDKWNIENKSSEFIFLYCGTNFFMRMSAMHNLKAAGL